MKFDHPELELSYSVKDAPSYRDVLRYDGAVASLRGAEMYLRLWEAARTLINEWHAPIILDVDLDAVADAAGLEIIKVVSLEVFSYRQQLDDIPKN